MTSGTRTSVISRDELRAIVEAATVRKVNQYAEWRLRKRDQVGKGIHVYKHGEVWG